MLCWAVDHARPTVLVFLALMVVSITLFPQLGRDFFPEVDAGQMRLHVRAPPGTRIEVLNFGQPAPIDVRVSGPDSVQTYELAQRLARQLTGVPGVVDAHVAQVPDAPALTVDVDRALATQVGMSQRETANNVLVTTNSSAQVSPNFWVDPRNGVSYPLVVQQPTYTIESAQDLKTMPVSVSTGAADQGQLLMNLSEFGRRRRAHGHFPAEHSARVRRAGERAGS